MEKLIKKAHSKLEKHSRKGFTLIELIVVIVILAILIAALVPAILGVINAANRTADEADCRSVMMGASVAGMTTASPSSVEIHAQFTGTSNIADGVYEVYFDGPIAVGVELISGGRTGSASVGVVSSTISSLRKVQITFPSS